MSGDLRGELTAKLIEHGYVVRPAWLNEAIGKEAFSKVGRVLEFEGVPPIQVLVPRNSNSAPPNTYSGNYGAEGFPLHTDLAHWFSPPRFFALRCISGAPNVFTRLIDSHRIISALGTNCLSRVLVRPRRPLRRSMPLMSLYRGIAPGVSLFRWDNIFIRPEGTYSKEVWQTVGRRIAECESIDVAMVNFGDTLIVDNWRMLHGRTSVHDTGSGRKIERAYLGEIYG